MAASLCSMLGYCVARTSHMRLFNLLVVAAQKCSARPRMLAWQEQRLHSCMACILCRPDAFELHLPACKHFTAACTQFVRRKRVPCSLRRQVWLSDQAPASNITVSMHVATGCPGKHLTVPRHHFTGCAISHGRHLQMDPADSNSTGMFMW
jgi:hypothetical protein